MSSPEGVTAPQGECSKSSLTLNLISDRSFRVVRRAGLYGWLLGDYQLLGLLLTRAVVGHIRITLISESKEVLASLSWIGSMVILGLAVSDHLNEG